MTKIALLHSGSILLSLLIFLPLAGALLLFLIRPSRKDIARLLALGTSALTFILSLMVLTNFDGTKSAVAFELVENRTWLPALGVRYVLGVDGMSIWFLVLTTFLTFLVILAAKTVEKKARAYLGLILLLETGMLGTFLALDGITFYIFWELMLIPMYFLIGIWGGKRRIYAALKFVLFTAFGSLLMLVAIIYLAILHQQQFHELSFLLSDWMELRLSFKQELLLFLAFALAFAIKIPVFPLHTWLPDAHVEAPTGGSVILAGVLLKMGLYGLVRFGMPVFPNALLACAPAFAVLGVIGIVYGALVAWVQTDIKKLVAYSSVSHLGFCVLGFATLELYGMQGAMLQMLNHGISTGALFFLVGVLYDRKHTREIKDYSGLAGKVPLFCFVFLVFTLSSIGLPLTNGFVGEFLILLGTFDYDPVTSGIAVTGVVLGALYMLSLYRRVSFGELNADRNGDLTDLTWHEKLVFAPLLVMVFVLGLCPTLFLDRMDTAVRRHLDYVHVNEKPSKQGDVRQYSSSKSTKPGRSVGDT